MLVKTAQFMPGNSPLKTYVTYELYLTPIYNRPEFDVYFVNTP